MLSSTVALQSPGDKVPVDGIVVDGHFSVEESMLGLLLSPVIAGAG